MEAAKILIGIGLVCIIAGVMIVLIGKVPGLGRLPGDFVFRRGDTTIYVPLGTCILISVILSIIMYFGNQR